MSKQEPIDIKAELRAHIARKYRTQTAAAKAWGCSTAYVSAILRGAKVPTVKMLDDAGFYMERKVRYYKVKS